MGKFRVKKDQIDKEKTCAVPSDFASRVMVKSAAGRHVTSEFWNGRLEFHLIGSERYPLTITYMQNLLNSDFDATQLPPTCISLLSDYLELLITIPNSERQRRIAIAGKLDVSDIPAEPDLTARKTELETSMRQNRAIVPPLSFL